MSEVKYSLSADTWDKKEKKVLVNLIKSNAFLTYSKNVIKFEKKLANYFNSRYAILVNSGSSANLLGIYTLFFMKNKLKKGDEVIIPAIGWSTSYAPLVQLGLKIVLCDVDADTFNISLKSLNKCITKKTKLILAINLIGNISNLFEIRKICNKKNIYLFEDNCEGMGSKINSKYCGTFGIASSFSTYFSHHISTIEGGFVLTNSSSFYNIAKSIRSHGWTRNIDINKINLSKSEISKIKKDKNNKFQFIFPGFNLRPTELTAVLGLSQITKLSRFLKARAINQRYVEKIYSDHSDILNFYQFQKSAAYFFIPLFFKKIKHKKAFENLILNKKEIEYRTLISGNIKDHIFIKYFGKLKNINLSNTELVSKRVILFGNSHNNLKNELDLLRGYLEKLL